MNAVTDEVLGPVLLGYDGSDAQEERSRPPAACSAAARPS